MYQQISNAAMIENVFNGNNLMSQFKLNFINKNNQRPSMTATTDEVRVFSFINAHRDFGIAYLLTDFTIGFIFLDRSKMVIGPDDQYLL